MLNEDSGARSDQTLIKSAERRRRVFYDSGAAVWFLTPNQLNSSAAPDVKAPVGLLVNKKKKEKEQNHREVTHCLDDTVANANGAIVGHYFEA